MIGVLIKIFQINLNMSNMPSSIACLVAISNAMSFNVDQEVYKICKKHLDQIEIAEMFNHCFIAILIGAIGIETCKIYALTAISCECQVSC